MTCKNCGDKIPLDTKFAKVKCIGEFCNSGCALEYIEESCIEELWNEDKDPTLDQEIKLKP